MKNRIFAVIAVILICILGVSACKKNVGTPEDNAASEETEETKDGEEEEVKHLIGFSAIDMNNPYFITLESAIKEVLEQENYELLMKDPGTDPEMQATQITEMIEEGIEAIILSPVE